MQTGLLELKMAELLIEDVFNLKTHHWSYINEFNNKNFGRYNWGRAQRPAPTGVRLSLGEIVERFKSYTAKQYIKGVE